MPLKDELRTLLTAAKLGWAIESNWTDVYLFVVYSVARPVASALVLVFMYLVVAGGNTRPEVMGFLVVGNAFWAFVSNGLQGLAWGVLDDRERYLMLKYVYIAPARFYTYLLGRGSAQLASASAAAVITLGVGGLFLGVPIDLSRLNWPLLLLALALGYIGIAAVGIAVAGLSLNISRESWGFSEGVAGTLFLLCGAIFPIAVLPDWVQPIARALPFTYWLEAIRRAFFGTTQGFSLTDLDTAQVLLYLVVTTVAFAFLANLVFAWSEHRAKERGLIDWVSGS
ncbi:MAG: ABC transporter permease [Chloroflexi bacterium]|nr:ABC transporter permease [Chloroflexota bacterium]